MQPMVVSELIEWLKTQDQGATVAIVAHTSGHTCYDQGGNASEEPFDPSKHVEYTDFRGNPYAKGKPYENERTLLLGQLNG